MPTGCYRSQWWITNNEQGAYFAAGIYGQWIYVSPGTETVIVKQASPRCGTGRLESLSLRAGCIEGTCTVPGLEAALRPLN